MGHYIRSRGDGLFFQTLLGQVINLHEGGSITQQYPWSLTRTFSKLNVNVNDYVEKDEFTKTKVLL